MSLADRVAARVEPHKPGPKHFLERLPPDARDELLEVRRRFQAGEYGTTAAALARVILEEADGLQLCGHHGLRIWLAARD